MRSAMRPSAVSMGMSCPSKAKSSSLSWAMVFQLAENVGDWRCASKNQIGDRLDVVKAHHRRAGAGKWRVAGDRDDARVLRMQRRTAIGGAKDFELGMSAALETFDDDEVARRKASQQRRQIGLGRIAKLMHQRPSARRGDDDLAGAGGAETIGILARLIDVKI